MNYIESKLLCADTYDNSEVESAYAAGAEIEFFSEENSTWYGFYCIGGFYEGIKYRALMKAEREGS